jgi:acetyl-CoA carboxylase biotin carboxyl carrier protein
VSLTAADIQEIMRLVEESHFDEIELETQGVKLHLRRGAAVTTTATVAASAPAAMVAAPSVPTPAAQPVPAERPAGSGQDVPSPMLGTFYRSPKPGASPFVEVGARVETDTVICIIEVMKLMNTVRAGVRGRVTEILPADGALVEFGESLIRVALDD